MALLSPANATGNATLNSSLNSTSNNTINSSLAATIDKAAAAVGTAQSFIPLVFTRLWELIAAPFRHAEMLWIIFPLFFTLIVMEFYYDRHDDEEMGWGAALANSLVLIFVAIDLIKTSFGNETPWVVLKQVMLAVFVHEAMPVTPQVLMLIIFVGSLGLGVTLINYFHLLPRKVAYVVSGHPPINYLAYFAIAIVYSTGTEHPIPFDMATLVAGGLLFILILLAVFGAKLLFRRFLGGRSRWD
jgi:hypothetical protein